MDEMLSMRLGRRIYKNDPSVLAELAQGSEEAIEALTFALRYEPYTAERMLRQIGAPALPRIILALQSEDPRLREAAASFLGRFGDMRAIDPLIATLSDKVNHVRCAAATALGDLQDPRAIEPLAKGLRDKSITFRSVTTKALSRIDSPAALDLLFVALGDVSSMVQETAIDSLRRYGPQADERLMEELRTRSSAGVRARLISILEFREVTKASPLIIAALDDPDEHVAAAATHAIGVMGITDANKEQS